MRIYFITFFVTLMIVGCTKVSIDCTYKITTYTETEKEGERLSLNGATSHAFFCDTALYDFTSYEDALGGKIKEKNGTKILEANVSFTASDKSNLIELNNITSSPVVIVICDNVNKIYAFNQFEVGENLPLIVTSMKFTPWFFVENPDKNEYVVNRWTERR